MFARLLFWWRAYHAIVDIIVDEGYWHLHWPWDQETIRFQCYMATMMVITTPVITLLSALFKA